MRALKKSAIKGLTAAAVVAAVILIAGAALIFPARQTASANVYLDNVGINNLSLGYSTDINNILTVTPLNTGVVPYWTARASAGAGAYVLNKRWVLQRSDITAVRYEIWIIGTVNTVGVELYNVITIGGETEYTALYSKSYNITPSTTSITYSWYLAARDSASSFVFVVNGNVSQAGSLGIYLEDGVTHKFNVSMYDALEGGNIVNTSVYNSQSTRDIGAGYVNENLYNNLRAAGQLGSYQSGYDLGYITGNNAAEQASTWTVLQTIWVGMDTIMQTEILPNFKLWYLVGLPLASGLITWIVGMFRG